MNNNFRGVNRVTYGQMLRAGRPLVAVTTTEEYTTCGSCRYATPGKSGCYTCQLDSTPVLRGPQHVCERVPADKVDPEASYVKFSDYVDNSLARNVDSSLVRKMIERSIEATYGNRTFEPIVAAPDRAKAINNYYAITSTPPVPAEENWTAPYLSEGDKVDLSDDVSAVVDEAGVLRTEKHGICVPEFIVDWAKVVAVRNPPAPLDANGKAIKVGDYVIVGHGSKVNIVESMKCGWIRFSDGSSWTSSVLTVLDPTPQVGDTWRYHDDSGNPNDVVIAGPQNERGRWPLAGLLPWSFMKSPINYTLIRRPREE